MRCASDQQQSTLKRNAPNAGQRSSRQTQAALSAVPNCPRARACPAFQEHQEHPVFPAPPEHRKLPALPQRPERPLRLAHRTSDIRGSPGIIGNLVTCGAIPSKPPLLPKGMGKGGFGSLAQGKTGGSRHTKAWAPFSGTQASCPRSDQEANSYDPALLLSVGDLHGLGFLGHPEHAEKQNDAEDDVEYPYGAQDGIRAGNGGDGLVDG